MATVNAEIPASQREEITDYGLLGLKLDTCTTSKAQVNAAEEKVESM